MNDGAAAWTAHDEAEWIALHEAQYGVQPLGGPDGFIATVNPKYPPPKHLKPLTDLLEETRHHPVFAIVSMPPRHRKTTTVDNAIAKYMGDDPALSHAFITFNDRKARRESRLIRQIAVNSGRVRLDPRRQSLNEWGVLDGNGNPAGTLWAAGWGGGLTGVGITGLLVIDDLIKNRKEANSPTLREDQWDWLIEVALTRLEPGASVIIVMTRWHEDDIAGRLEEKWAEISSELELKTEIPEWRHIRLPAVCESEDDGTGRKVGEALWPEKYPLSYLKLRERLNQWAFSALYQQQPRTPGGKLFNEPMRYKLEQLLERGFDGMRLLIACDPAASDSDQACYWAAGLLAARGYGDELEVFLVDLLHEQYDPITGAEELYKFQQKWGAPILLEGGTVGKAPKAALKRLQPDLEVIEVIPQLDKWLRAQPAAGGWKRGKYKIPLSVEWAKVVIKEAKAFTGKSSAQADIVDMLSHGWNFFADQADPDATHTQRASHMPLW